MTSLFTEYWFIFNSNSTSINSLRPENELSVNWVIADVVTFVAADPWLAVNRTKDPFVNFCISDIFDFRKFTCYILLSMFILDRHHCSLAVVTPVKYEHDTQLACWWLKVNGKIIKWKKLTKYISGTCMILKVQDLYYNTHKRAHIGQSLYILSLYGDIIMGAIASQITSLMIVYSTVYSDAD